MLQVIIFSFNRALQLKTLLDSMSHYIECTNYTVDVLYNVSSDEFSQGYNKLIEDCKPQAHIHFIKEENISKLQALSEVFKVNGKSELKYFINSFRKKKHKTNFRRRLIELLKENESSSVMFLTDDACFIEKTVISNDIVDWINATPFSRQFSLRTGKGINQEPDDVVSIGNQIEWIYYKHPLYTLWGYPFSVDAHIYNKAAIVKALSSCYFNNPNSLEGFVSLYAQKKKLFGTGRAFTRTRILSFPINIVQNVANNESLNISVDELNQYYLQGYSLEYPLPEEITTFQNYPNSLTLKHPNKEVIVIKTSSTNKG